MDVNNPLIIFLFCSDDSPLKYLKAAGNFLPITQAGFEVIEMVS